MHTAYGADSLCKVGYFETCRYIITKCMHMYHVFSILRPCLPATPFNISRVMKALAPSYLILHRSFMFNKMPRLSIESRNRVVKLRRSGMRYSVIKKRLEVEGISISERYVILAVSSLVARQ